VSLASTMRNRYFGIVLATMCLSACAHDPTNQEIKSQCRLEMEAGRTAVQMREQGRTKQAMLQTLPPLHADSSRLLRSMYQSIDDTYTFPALNNTVYGIYRFEVCARQLLHQPAPPPLPDIAQQLVACQTKFGRQASPNIVRCVRATCQQETQPRVKNR